MIDKKEKFMKKIVVITGASSGIGKFLKEEFEKKEIVISLSRKQEKTDFSYPCDVANLESINDAFKFIQQKYGRIDILINNAGYGVCGVTELLPENAIKENFDVNFFGLLNCIKKALPLMNNKSKIFNINSACALFPLPFRSIYCASKSASHMLSLSMRMELLKYGIEVVSICPGDIKTNFSKNRIIFEDENIRSHNLKKTLNKISSRENKRMPLNKAGKKILKICNKQKTKPLYIIGFQYKIFYFFSKILPISWFNKILYKLFAK